MSRVLLSQNWYRVAGLRPRLRPHVGVTRQEFRGTIWHVLEDSAHNRHHRFPQAGYAAISLMDGTRTVDEIWRALGSLGEERPTQDDVIQLLAQLDGADLLATDRQPDFHQLDRRSRQQSGQKMMRRLLSPLYLRLPLVDPDRFLTATAPFLRPLWSVWGVLLWLAVVGSGVAQAALHWTALTGNISDKVLAADNLLILSLTFPLVKLLHELGHGYAAKLGGAEVHEAGVMTLVVMPVPYIDVTASVAFRSRWQRALVAAAGMLVELFVAGLAMMVWTAAEPGLVRAAAFNAMLIAGVSTLVFNGNPLLRFDAYYILCDLIEIPNLASRANRYWSYLVTRYVYRVPEQVSPVTAPGEAAWFLFYAPASYLYRLTVMASIALFVATLLHGLGAVLAIWTIAVGVALPIGKGVWFLATSPVLRQHRARAIGLTVLTVGGAAALLFLLPLPYGTVVQGIVWAPPEAELRAGAEGTVLAMDAAPGALVSRGDKLVVMGDPLLEARVGVLEAQLSEIRLRQFAAQSTDQVQAQMYGQQAAYFTSEVAEARRRRAELTVRSPTAGALLLGFPQDLPGKYLRRGELIGHVVDGTAASIRVVVPQSDIDLVRQGTRAVDIRFASDPLTVYHSPPITREVPTATRELPSAALSVTGGGAISTEPSDDKHIRAVELLFQVDLALPQGLSADRLGERVYVRLDHGTRTIGWYAARKLRQVFLRRFSL